MITYEEKLDSNIRLAIEEGGLHFEKRSAVHKTLRKFAARLDALGVPYAVTGDLAMFFHGYRRFTEIVELLVTREGLKCIHEALEGLGYLPPFTGSKHLRDTENGVKIEFLVTGDFPGDGKPKPVAFPDPTPAGEIRESMNVIRLDKVVELKLASGMTNPGRMKDLADVQELIRVLKLPEGFDAQLDPFVRDKYRELYAGLACDPQQPE